MSQAPTISLDSRQRAMLHEMGVHVWLPEPADVFHVKEVSAPSNAIKIIANNQANTPAIDVNRDNLIEARHSREGGNPQGGRIPENRNDAARVLDSRLRGNESAGTRGQSQTPAQTALKPLPAGLLDMDWSALEQAAQSCQACQLCTSRKHAVFGTQAQTPQTDWFVVGDPPTEADEAQNAPFTADAAVLLANMLKAVGLSVAQVTLTSAVKCRSEGLSTGVTELAQCAAYLQRQIALTRPKMILAMGRYAAQVLLQQAAPEPLSKLRGVVHNLTLDDQRIPLVITYPPAALLRNPVDKAKAWADLCLARSVL